MGDFNTNSAEIKYEKYKENLSKIEETEFNYITVLPLIKDEYSSMI